MMSAIRRTDGSVSKRRCSLPAAAVNRSSSTPGTDRTPPRRESIRSASMSIPTTSKSAPAAAHERVSPAYPWPRTASPAVRLRMARRSRAVSFMMAPSAGSGGGTKQLRDVRVLVQLDQLPDGRSPSSEALPARDVKRSGDVSRLELNHVPEDQHLTIAILEELHAPAELGALVQRLQQARSHPILSRLGTAGSADLQDGGGCRLPPIRIGEETTDHTPPKRQGLHTLEDIALPGDAGRR